MNEEEQIKIQCRRTARQLLREQPKLTFEELSQHSDIRLACNYQSFPKWKLFDLIYPDLSVAEEIPYYKKLSVWTKEEAVAIWLDRNPWIVRFSDHDPAFWNRAYHPQLRERVSLSIDLATRDIISGKLVATTKDGVDYVKPVDFYNWAIENIGEPQGNFPPRLFEELLSEKSCKNAVSVPIADHAEDNSMAEIQDNKNVQVSQYENLASQEQSENIEIPPGDMPRTSVGKLAIEVAWEIECGTGKKAVARDVMSVLQKMAENGRHPDILLRSDSKGRQVVWITSRYEEKSYSLEACQKHLERWNDSRGRL